MKTVPCKDCKDRHVSCHSSCVKYIEWKQMLNELKTELAKQRMYTGISNRGKCISR